MVPRKIYYLSKSYAPQLSHQGPEALVIIGLFLLWLEISWNSINCEIYGTQIEFYYVPNEYQLFDLILLLADFINKPFLESLFFQRRSFFPDMKVRGTNKVDHLFWSSREGLGFSIPGAPWTLRWTFLGVSY